MIGGVLVEQTLDETIESLKQTVNMLEQTLKALDEEMGKRQKQVVELEMKYNLNPNNKQAELVQWFCSQTNKDSGQSSWLCILLRFGNDWIYFMDEIWIFLNFVLMWMIDQY